MFARSTLVLLAFSIAGCPEEGTVHDHDTDPAQPALAEGAYSVAVLAVNSFDCEADPRGLVGQSLPAYLDGAGDEVRMSVAGFSLEGSMNGGLLSVEGSMGEGWAQPVEAGGDEPVAQDRDYAAEYEDEDEDEDARYEDRESPPEDREPQRLESWMAIEAELYDTETAIGSLFLQVDRCSAELKVAIAFVGEARGDDGPPVAMETSEVEEYESECDDEASDCG